MALAAMRSVAGGKHVDLPSTPPATVIGADLRALLRPGPLDEAESKGLFAHFGIPVTREIVADTAEGAGEAAKTFDGKVVVKVLSRHVLHKSEVGGVAIGVLPEDVSLTCAQIEQRFIKATQHKPEGFLVQELVSGGIELILGFHRDAQLGPLVLLGMGGVTAELYRDTSMRLAPVSKRDAETMIDELKSAALLKGFRGRALADVAALVDAIVAFSNMVVTVGDNLQEAEINPLFVMPQGHGVIAGDGVAIINSPIQAQ